ncbi:MAG: serine/threonine protein kinase [Ignavibacteriae bacterium HGW-Ignavibacteriae-3]|nr:MAG: serine/threonine protein kinase [Ignavibacteriae bacterium HGW-Ignavibacteriae-3]
MIGKTISHYKIVEKIGDGGMGVVYKAEDAKLKRTVALKFLPPILIRNEEARKRFLNEAQIVSKFDHSNICTIYDIIETDDDQICIAMPCYHGETLKNKIANGKLCIEEVTDITRQIAEGLKKAHENGIIHRDIKPANIFITNDGVVKILDFGLAKLSDSSLITKIGFAAGTVSYMSPEQARGEQVDKRTDIWALGAVIYEMLAGKSPFHSDYEQAAIYSILNENPVEIALLRSGIPQYLIDLVNLCLKKNKNDRVRSAEDILASLSREKSFNSKFDLRKLMTVPNRKYTISVVVLLFALIGVFTVLNIFPTSPQPNKKYLLGSLLFLNQTNDTSDTQN